MNKLLYILILLAFTALVFLAGWGKHALGVGPAHGAETVKDEELTLLLARTCVAEIGFEGQIAECEIMWSLNQQNAQNRGRSLWKQTRKYNSYWKCPVQRDRRPWIQYLDGYEKPKHWRMAKWSKFKNKWMDIRSAAEVFVHSHRQFFHDCRGSVEYGAPGETPKMGYRMTRKRCLGGTTRQRYWFWK
jgi:hypothetical protein